MNKLRNDTKIWFAFNHELEPALPPLAIHLKWKGRQKDSTVLPMISNMKWIIEWPRNFHYVHSILVEKKRCVRCSMVTEKAEAEFRCRPPNGCHSSIVRPREKGKRYLITCRNDEKRLFALLLNFHSPSPGKKWTSTEASLSFVQQYWLLVSLCGRKKEKSERKMRREIRKFLLCAARELGGGELIIGK